MALAFAAIQDCKETEFFEAVNFVDAKMAYGKAGGAEKHSAGQFIWHLGCYPCNHPLRSCVDEKQLKGPFDQSTIQQ